MGRLINAVVVGLLLKNLQNHCAPIWQLDDSFRLLNNTLVQPDATTGRMVAMFSGMFSHRVEETLHGSQLVSKNENGVVLC